MDAARAATRGAAVDRAVRRIRPGVDAARGAAARVADSGARGARERPMDDERARAGGAAARRSARCARGTLQRAARRGGAIARVGVEPTRAGRRSSSFRAYRAATADGRAHDSAGKTADAIERVGASATPGATRT